MQSETTKTEHPQRIFLKDYTPPSHKILSTELFFNLHETKTRIICKQHISGKSSDSLFLNGEGLELISVKINGLILKPELYEVTDVGLSLFNLPQEFNLETEVEVNPQENKSCEGLYLSKSIFATQCEAESFRKITYFLDRPDVMSKYLVHIEADKNKFPVLLSNGDLIDKKDLNNGRHQVTWSDPFKKPCYLFALVAGDLGVVKDEFTTLSGKKVKLEVYASHGKQSRCHHAMESLKKSMKWDEERYGLEYDLSQYMIVSIDDFNMGAMENKGLNIFNSRLVLADKESATDTDFERIESVVGHEYFHNWTGNRVTCRNWFELSLKEGLTVFRDQEFSADMNSRSVQRIKDVDALRSMQFAEDAGPNSHPVRPESCLAVDNFYTATIYEKGSEIIRMMQTIVGRKGFRLGMNEYFKRYDGQAVTILDFADAIATPNKADFSQLKLWYTQSGTPEVFVTESYSSQNQTYTLHLKQYCKPTEKQTQTSPFHIPLLIALFSPAGQSLKLNSSDVTYNSDEQPLIHLKLSEQTFTFTNLVQKPVLSLNRDFSAPIKLSWNATHEDLLTLIKFDNDAFNRREALFKMCLQEIRRIIGCLRTNPTLQPTPNSEIINSLGFVLADKNLESNFKALMLHLPDDEILAQEEEILDAVLFKKAQFIFISYVVKTYEQNLIDIYKEHSQQDNSGSRALKNKVLSYLAIAMQPEAITLAKKQFDESKNMTDTIGAMLSLNKTSSSERQMALDDFYKKWKLDSVVFNKWLQLQAASTLEDTASTVKKVTQLPEFSIENPNNVFSLHRVFAQNYFAIQSNPEVAISWLCDEILKVDKINPQVAARLCSGFNFVKKFPDPCKSMALNKVAALLKETGLSKNAREILEKCV